ncbi:MAG: hypothetical protein J0M13_09860 [Candidatus Accumulibacter sp.]|nr:hypothetical protein [Candidatus Accumulibacter necessarius]
MTPIVCFELEEIALPIQDRLQPGAENVDRLWRVGARGTGHPTRARPPAGESSRDFEEPGKERHLPPAGD